MKQRGKILFLVLALAFILISLSNFSQAGTLKVTQEHPFLVNGEWISASDLKAGDELTTIEGKKVKITSIQDVETKEPFPVYNLEAGKYSNFVIDGGDGLGVVVHNSDLLVSEFPNKNIITLDRFKSQARYSLGKVKNHDVLYRVDSRPPEIILSEEGFFPNFNIPEGNLLKHTMQKKGYTGSFVSTTTKESNPMLFRSGFFWKNSERLAGYEWDDIVRISKNGPYPIKLDLPQSRYKIYEYKVMDVEGVRVHFPFARYAGEREVVTRAIPSDKIVAYREVFVTRDWYLKKKPFRDSWQLNIPRGYSMSEVSFGEWKSFP